MLDDIKIESDGLVDEIVRSISIVEEDPSQTLPAMKVESTYLKRDTLRKLTKPFIGKRETNDSDEARFRTGIVEATWRGWSGVTLRNMCRTSEFVLLNYSALKKKFEEKGMTENDELSWDIADAKWFATRMDNAHFQPILEEAQRMEEYALLVQAKEKN